jgi:hypothetical protein
MEHRHNYETVSRPAVSPEARELGVRGTELRKCKDCEKVMPFVLIHEKWIPLFEDSETGEKDILLA